MDRSATFALGCISIGYHKKINTATDWWWKFVFRAKFWWQPMVAGQNFLILSTIQLERTVEQKLYQKHVGHIFSSMIVKVLCTNKHSEWRLVQVLSSGYYFLPNNMHEKIYPFWLVKSSAFFKTVQKRVNSVQKEVTNQAVWLVNDQRNSPMANQIFRFQIKCTPWMAQLMA